MLFFCLEQLAKLQAMSIQNQRNDCWVVDGNKPSDERYRENQREWSIILLHKAQSKKCGECTLKLNNEFGWLRKVSIIDFYLLEVVMITYTHMNSGTSEN